MRVLASCNFVLPTFFTTPTNEIKAVACCSNGFLTKLLTFSSNGPTEPSDVASFAFQLPDENAAEQREQQ